MTSDSRWPGLAEAFEVLRGQRQWAVVTAKHADVLPLFCRKSFDVTISDPPYTEHVHRRLRSASTDAGIICKGVECGFDSLGSVSEVDVPRLVRLTKRWVLCFSAIESLGEYQAACPKSWIRSGIYHKQRAVPQFSGDRPGNACEGLAIFHDDGRKRWNGGGTHAFWTAMPEDRASTGHPTAKPVALMLQLVEAFSEPGEVILDHYAGSGTTGIAAIRTGRRVVLVECNPAHAETARQRCEAEASQTSMQAARAGQMALFG
jgi:site-specific DNA-methyltransferase (adenine-specific)